jgi:hypothetical protein
MVVGRHSYTWLHVLVCVYSGIAGLGSGKVGSGARPAGKFEGVTFAVVLLVCFTYQVWVSHVVNDNN